MGLLGQEYEASGSMSPIVMVIFLAFMVVIMASMWKVFTKAGQPGWGILIPFYNAYLMLKIAQKPGWWLILYFIPFVNIVVAVLASIGIAKAFGKSAGFGWGLLILGFIFYPILGFGDSQYQGPAASDPIIATA